MFYSSGPIFKDKAYQILKNQNVEAHLLDLFFEQEREAGSEHIDLSLKYLVLFRK